MTSEKITVTLGELVDTFLNKNKPLPEFSVLISGKEYKADNENIAVTDKEGTFKVFLLEEFKGKKVITADGSKVKVSYDPPKVVKQDTAKTDKAEAKKQAKPEPAKDLTVDFLVNPELIDRLVANNDSEMLGKIAKLQSEFLKLQKDLCDRLIADTDTPIAQSETTKKPNSDEKVQRGPTFNEKLDSLKKAYHYVETAKASGKKVAIATLEAKEKFYWANKGDVATGKDRFNNMINAYRFTLEKFGSRKGDMHRHIIDSGLSFNEWYDYCVSADKKAQAEKVFFG